MGNLRDARAQEDGGEADERGRPLAGRPGVADVLAEVERRHAERPNLAVELPRRELTTTERRAVMVADRVIFWFTHHWLTIFNLMALLYVGLPFLAPIFMHVGWSGAGRLIYAMYTPLCHQLPDRSFFLFGRQSSYSFQEMYELVGTTGVMQHGFIGSPELGFKIALCQRDVAIYGTIFVAGLAFGLLRKRVRQVPLWAYVLFGVFPPGIDGGLQMLFGWRGMFPGALAQWIPTWGAMVFESTPLRRVISGLLFGLMTVWLAYPNVEEAVSEIRTTLQEKFGWK